jgi:Tol biopolymer transport system component
MPALLVPAPRSRRSVLWLACAAAWGAVALSSLPARADDGPGKEGRAGQIFALVRRFAANNMNGDGLAGVISIDPETATWRQVVDFNDDAFATPFFGTVRVSPDGRSVLLSSTNREDPGVWTFDSTGENRPRKIWEKRGYAVWAPDGKRIVVNEPQASPTGIAYECWLMNADGSNPSRLPIASADGVFDWSSDGRWLLLLQTTKPRPKGGRFSIVAVAHPDGIERRALTEEDQMSGLPTFSPDGKTIAYRTVETVDEKDITLLWMVGVDGTNRRQIPFPLEPEEYVGFARWSPDGKRMAVTVSGAPPTRIERIEIFAPDGSQRRTLQLPTGQVLLLDWR